MDPQQPEPHPRRLAGTLVVDAIEGRYARVELEDGEIEDWPLAKLPRGVREGQVVRLSVQDGGLTVEIDHEATRERHGTAQAQLDDLNRASPAGEIDL